MKIKHIKIEENFWDFKSKFLSKNKLKFLAGGAFGSVYINKNAPKTARTVYKISLLNDYGIDGYLCYLKHVILKSTNNPFTPNVYGVNLYEYQNDEGDICYFYIMKMERLNHYNSVSGDIKAKKIASYGLDPLVTQGLWGRTINWMDDFDDYMEDDETSYSLRPMPAGLQYVFRKSRKIIQEGSDVCSDMHSGNAMWRGTGARAQLVIVDPIS